MRRKLTALALLFFPVLIFAQRRFPDGSLTGGPTHLNGDQQIAAAQKQAVAQPSNAHFQNLLASAYIQKMRESTDFSYLERASKIVDGVLSADASNYEAMRLRSEMEMERHHFAQVADYSAELTKIAPDDPFNFGLLGDSRMELGQPELAEKAYKRMIELRPNQASYNRMAYYSFVTGAPGEAIGQMNLAIAAGGWSPENTAWCLVEQGKMYFKTGQLAAAEQAFSSALALFGGYHSANAGLGSVKAAQGKTVQAIDLYRRAQASVPLPDYAAALYSLYTQAGQPKEAAKQLELVDIVDQLDRATGQLTNRNLAIIYCDENRRIARALELIREELKVRPDVYSYDALAWALFKDKQYADAQGAVHHALKLGTPEPGFYYHAGMIAAALGRKEDAVKLLERALELNPNFDPMQAPIAAQTLAGLRVSK
jgi:tetratricopeptide (TPR) repeat protein